VSGQNLRCPEGLFGVRAWGQRRTLYPLTDNNPGEWAATIAVSAASMAFFGVVVIAERLLVPWREER
jgi:hypothetical protein